MTDERVHSEDSEDPVIEDPELEEPGEDDERSAGGADELDDDAREVLLEDGGDPEDFFPSVPHPF